jgi:hypothetical protein
VSWLFLKNKLQGKLDVSLASSRTLYNLTELRIRHIRGGAGREQCRVVEDVVELGSKLHVVAFLEPVVLNERTIEVDAPGPRTLGWVSESVGMVYAGAAAKAVVSNQRLLV